MKSPTVATRKLWSLFPVILGLGLALLCAVRLRAQPVEVQPPPSSRYLLVVDISLAMDARARNTLKTLEDLLKSDMGGQIKAGDSLGLWTFNSSLYAGRFPLQRWLPNERNAITEHVLTFLKQQKREKAADLEPVMGAMERLIKDSQLITIVLVSAGDSAIHGTPFDDRINDFWQRWQEKQKSARMPFVLVLRARNGEIVDYSLNRPPFPVQMPYLPVEPQIAKPVQRNAPEVARPPQAAAVPPLIISGNKAKPLHPPKVEEEPPVKTQAAASAAQDNIGSKEAPASVPAALSEPRAVKPEIAPAKVEIPVTAPATPPKPAEAVKGEEPRLPADEIAKATPPPALPEPAAVAATLLTFVNGSDTPAGMPALPAVPEAKPVQASAPVQPPAPNQSLPPAAAPATPVESAAKKEIALAPAPVQVLPPAKPAESTPAPAPKTENAKTPEPLPAVAALAAPATPAPASSATLEAAKPPETTPVASSPAQQAAAPSQPLPPKPSAPAPESPKPAPAPAAKAEPAPAPAPPSSSSIHPPAASVPAPTQNLATVAVKATALPAKPPQPATPPAPPRAVPAAPVSPPPPDVQAAVVVPPGTFLSQNAAWLAGIALLAAAIGFGLMSLRRTRSRTDASLITRSLDRHKRK